MNSRSQRTPNTDIERLLLPQDVAALIGVKLSTVYQWTHLGYIPHVKLGRLIRFKRISIQRWLEQQEMGGRDKQLPKIDASDAQSRTRTR